MHGPRKEHVLVHLLLEEDKEAAWRVSEAICCSAVSKILVELEFISKQTCPE